MPDLNLHRSKLISPDCIKKFVQKIKSCYFKLQLFYVMTYRKKKKFIPVILNKIELLYYKKILLRRSKSLFQTCLKLQ